MKKANFLTPVVTAFDANGNLDVQANKNVWDHLIKGGGISIDMLSSGSFFSEIADNYEAILSIIRRHPMNQFEVESFMNSRKEENIKNIFMKLENDSKINVIDYKGIKTYRLK